MTRFNTILGMMGSCTIDLTARKAKPEVRRGGPYKVDNTTLALIRGDSELRGMTGAAIAAKYKLSAGTVSNYLNYYSRPHVEAK